ncbi:hypothetical protein SS7213T_03260, partial [Staphylococcus simiae CCM 7213 = CCUG 51256]
HFENQKVTAKCLNLSVKYILSQAHKNVIHQSNLTENIIIELQKTLIEIIISIRIYI